MAVLILFFLFFAGKSDSLEICEGSCGVSGPTVRFPFGLKNNDRCSFPGFNLSCNKNADTILTLPRSGDFIVKFIRYETQEIYIRDPEHCLPKRFLSNFSLSGSPFMAENYPAFSFLNCSSYFPFSSLPPLSRLVPCLSKSNFTVFAIPVTNYDGFVPSIPSCKVIKPIVDVPVIWHPWTDEDTMLVWSTPDCRACEERGGTCGYKDDARPDVGCYDLPSNKRRGLPRSAKYGIIIGAGIPGLLCIIGLVCYLCGRIRTYSRSSRGHSATQLPITFLETPPRMAAAGLDLPTIELYPKTLLGESRRLPKPNDNTCPICLCEYEPKETLRTIPECNHYFHADCIDEWLKMNATCPLCRNLPRVSSLGTPASSFSTSSGTPASPFSASSSSLSSGTVER
ncbi:hypothetical protein JCGZ_20454 [Jatropha curcas]|uniref:RING-type E3 ubiquitin transferase n=1 Tax=Jatropha curcas TaxID=180498 RepID=A0A067JR73_JATCU|nr:putative RING-H2 finger protein ATL21B [Jatropha curcas]KDP25298.1 hypothetical protein JCGZ_20454 [Jatropha curcas]